MQIRVPHEDRETEKIEGRRRKKEISFAARRYVNAGRYARQASCLCARVHIRSILLHHIIITHERKRTNLSLRQPTSICVSDYSVCTHTYVHWRASAIVLYFISMRIKIGEKKNERYKINAEIFNLGFYSRFREIAERLKLILIYLACKLFLLVNILIKYSFFIDCNV